MRDWLLIAWATLVLGIALSLGGCSIPNPPASYHGPVLRNVVINFDTCLDHRSEAITATIDLLAPYITIHVGNSAYIVRCGAEPRLAHTLGHIITINPTALSLPTPHLTHTLAHEVLHLVGILTHASESNALLYPTLDLSAPASPTITEADHVLITTTL